MAEGAATMASTSTGDPEVPPESMDQLKSLFDSFSWSSCCFCQQELDIESDPWILSCIHSCCYNCLSHHKSEKSLRDIDGHNHDVSSTSSEPNNRHDPKCVHCNEVVDISIHHPNVFLIKYLHECTKVDKSKETDDQSTPNETQKVTSIDGTCSSCDNEGALVQFCSDCGGNICSECVTNHGKFKAMRTHRPCDINVSNEVVADVESDSRLLKYTQCVVHDQKFDRYCVQCETAVCKSCFLENTHNGHKWEPLEKVTAELTSYLRSQISDLNDKMVTIKESINIGNAKSDEITTKTDEIKKTINDYKVHLMKAVNELFGDLTTQVTNHTEKRLFEVSSAITELNICLTRLQKMSIFIKFLTTKDVQLPASFLCCKPLIENQINALLKQGFSSSVSSFQQEFKYDMSVMSADLNSGKEMVINSIKSAELLTDQKIMERRKVAVRNVTAALPPTPSPSSPGNRTTPDTINTSSVTNAGSVYQPGVHVVTRSNDQATNRLVSVGHQQQQQHQLQQQQLQQQSYHQPPVTAHQQPRLILPNVGHQQPLQQRQQGATYVIRNLPPVGQQSRQVIVQPQQQQQSYPQQNMQFPPHAAQPCPVVQHQQYTSQPSTSSSFILDTPIYNIRQGKTVYVSQLQPNIRAWIQTEMAKENISIAADWLVTSINANGVPGILIRGKWDDVGVKLALPREFIKPRQLTPPPQQSAPLTQQSTLPSQQSIPPQQLNTQVQQPQSRQPTQPLSSTLRQILSTATASNGDEDCSIVAETTSTASQRINVNSSVDINCRLPTAVSNVRQTQSVDSVATLTHSTPARPPSAPVIQQQQSNNVPSNPGGGDSLLAPNEQIANYHESIQRRQSLPAQPVERPKTVEQQQQNLGHEQRSVAPAPISLEEALRATSVTINPQLNVDQRTAKQMAATSTSGSAASDPNIEMMCPYCVVKFPKSKTMEHNNSDTHKKKKSEADGKRILNRVRSQSTDQDEDSNCTATTVSATTTISTLCGSVTVTPVDQVPTTSTTTTVSPSETVSRLRGSLTIARVDSRRSSSLSTPPPPAVSPLPSSASSGKGDDTEKDVPKGIEEVAKDDCQEKDRISVDGKDKDDKEEGEIDNTEDEKIDDKEPEAVKDVPELSSDAVGGTINTTNKSVKVSLSTIRRPSKESIEPEKSVEKEPEEEQIEPDDKEEDGGDPDTEDASEGNEVEDATDKEKADANDDEDNEEDEEEDFCTICKRDNSFFDSDSTVVLCFDCDKSYHFSCHVPLYQKCNGRFKCSNCVDTNNIPINESIEYGTRNKRNQQRCYKLMLFLLDAAFGPSNKKKGANEEPQLTILINGPPANHPKINRIVGPFSRTLSLSKISKFLTTNATARDLNWFMKGIVVCLNNSLVLNAVPGQEASFERSKVVARLFESKVNEIFSDNQEIKKYVKEKVDGLLSAEFFKSSPNSSPVQSSPKALFSSPSKAKTTTDVAPTTSTPKKDTPTNGLNGSVVPKDVVNTRETRSASKISSHPSSDSPSPSTKRSHNDSPTVLTRSSSNPMSTKKRREF